MAPPWCADPAATRELGVHAPRRVVATGPGRACRVPAMYDRCVQIIFETVSPGRAARPRGRPGPAGPAARWLINGTIAPEAPSGGVSRADSLPARTLQSTFSLQCMGSHETNSNNQDERNEDKRTAPAAHYPLTAHLRSNEHHVRRPQRTLSPTPLSPHVNLMDDMHRACARPPRQNRT